MRLFFLILSLSIGICAHSQNKQALSKSDSLFAKGVELYNQGNYKAAIPLFTESDKIDKAELDSTSNRREYSAMWLGSCYYKLGDEEKAKEIDSISYSLPPIDRRVTVKPDSIMSSASNYIKQQQYKEALNSFQQALQSQRELLGEKHYKLWNTFAHMGNCYYYLKEYEKATRYWHDSFQLLEEYSLQYKIESSTVILENLIHVYSELQNYQAKKESLLKVIPLYEKSPKEKATEDLISLLLEIADCCEKLEEYKEESSYLTEASEKLKAYQGENNESYFMLLYSLAESRGLQNQLLKKESLLHECLNIVNDIDIEQKDLYIASISASLLDISFNLGKYYRASQYCDIFLSKLNNIEFPQQQMPIYRILGAAALVYSNLGNYIKSNKLGLLALEKAQSTFGKESYEYADILSGLSTAFYNLQDYKKASEYQELALFTLRNINKTEDTNYLTGMGKIASLYSSQNNEIKAVEAATETWHIGQALYKEIDYTNIATLVNANLILYKSKEKGMEMTKWLLQLINDKFTDSEEKVHALKYIATMYYQLGNQEKALEIFKQGIELIRERGIAYANYLEAMAQCYQMTSEYDKAIELEEQAIDILRKQSLRDSTLIAYRYHALAEYQYAKGCIDKAFELQYLAIRCLSKKPQNQDSGTIIQLHNILGVWYNKLGIYEKAIEVLNKAKDICIEIYGEKSMIYANIIGNLGNSYGSLGDTQKAFSHTLQSVKIREQISDMNTKGNLIYTHNLACFYNQLGQHQKALELLLDVFNKQKAHGYEDYDSAIASAHNISYAYEFLGDYENAIRYEQKSLSMMLEKIRGKQIMDYTHNLSYLIRYYYKAGKINDAIASIKELLPLSSNIIRQNFSFLTSSERYFMWERMKPEIQLCMQSACTLLDSSLYSTAYDASLIYKGLLLNTNIEFQKLFEKEKNKELSTKFQKLNQLKKQLTSISNEKNKTIIDSLEQKFYQLEKELIKSSKQFGDFTIHLSLTWKDVQKKLKESDTAVEFISYVNAQKQVCYAALLLKKEWASPKLVNIAKEEEIIQKSNNKQNRPYYSSKLGELIWKNIISEANIHEGENIFFSPIGVLYQIPIEYLSFKNNKYVHEVFKLKRLSTTKALCYSSTSNISQQAIVYGGLKYDADTTALVVENKKYTDIPRDLNIQHTFYPDSLNLRDGAKYLPATKIEAEQIKQALENTRLQPALYMDLRGTEESFKALSGKNISMLHIATHGFYWTETEAKQTKDLDFLMMGDNNQSRYVEDKALTRSGLLLSGANIALKGNPLPEGLEDGILTAKELAGLDLRGLDLVVLSACQTGLGEITGDGVFGLQRDFKKAGANTLLMSLWKVDDNATQLLMTQFYKNLLAGKSKFESLREAQKYVRDYEVEIETTPDKRWQSEARQKEKQSKKPMPKEFKKIKKYKDPFYWAAFILLDAID